VFRLFKKLLVANRGEIAIRVLRACRELNIPSVAVFSEADRGAMHVRYADEAYCIGPSPAGESYLNIERIIEVSKRAGVDSIHPGYGFLAENAEFAEACVKAGIVFVGPSPRTIRLLGNKIAARRLAAQRGLPVVAGTEAITDPDEAIATADRIGYPVLIKAAAGGGGRGIRNVEHREAMIDAIRTASGEAQSAFGDGGVYVEKLVSPARHIEVQVIADRYGNTLALAERECSVQRRHQKLIEECPSPAIQAELRGRLNEAAVTIAQAAEYVNVGTVEFLLDADHNFYFLEMNTRLQVEHPVTEIVTGSDLVADQIRVAAGDPLGYSKETFSYRGWAIECRISAEDPTHGFVPSVGEIVFAREPAGPGIRVESALYDGIRVSEFYDPLVAKVTAWGRDRREAIRRMRRALEEFKIVGVQTNIPFHVAMLNDSRFLAGELDTEMVERGLPPLPVDGREAGNEQAALATAALLQHSRRGGSVRAATPAGNGVHAQENGHHPAAQPWRQAGRAAALQRTGAGGWRRPTG
jgi:acetyl-CoA carboxylase biotin carboxylase subunit